jgi:hypothetical protein
MLNFFRIFAYPPEPYHQKNTDMARTKEQILASILDSKAGFAALDGLNSQSLTAVWLKWASVVATVIYYFEVQLDLFRAEIDSITANAVVGRADWYVKKSYEFQYGDDLEVIDGVVKYPNIDLNKRIIKRAAYAKDTNNNTLLKVATTDSGGKIIAINPAQMQSFTDYINNLMFAGSYIAIQSQDTDYLKLFVDVYYDPLKYADEVKINVEKAVKNYLATLPFDGSVKKNAIIDAIQAVDGVEDVEIMTIEVRTNTGAWTPMGRIYTPVAGYIEIDSAFELLNHITLKTQ